MGWDGGCCTQHYHVWSSLCSHAKGTLVYLSGRRHRRVKDIFGPAVIATIFIHGLLSVLRILALYNGETRTARTLHSMHAVTVVPPLQATTPPWTCTLS